MRNMSGKDKVASGDPLGSEGPNTAFADAAMVHPRLPGQVEVIDCTLRDGEQSPGVAFNVAEKVELAGMLAAAGITVLDAGFPGASAADSEALQAIRQRELPISIAATARPITSDIRAAEAARADEVFMFMATSDFRLSQTLGLSRGEAELRFLSGAEEVVGRGMRLNLVFEDATRADRAWLCTIIERVARRVPLSRVVLADTVGCAFPGAIGHLFELIGERTAGVAALCAHCHNDFGLAVANTLATVAAGATAVTCTVNGIGERAGNADFAETVSSLTHLYGICHGVDPLQLQALSSTVERMSGIHMSAIKPVTGFNVFRHESGVHVDAMIKDSRSYEFLPSAWLGRQPDYVLGKHSGLAVVRELLARSGSGTDQRLAVRILADAKRQAEHRDKGRYHKAYDRHASTQRQMLAGVMLEDLLASHQDAD